MNFCHLYPEYCFLPNNAAHARNEDSNESFFPSGGQVPFTIKKFCVFLNPALYFSQIPESKNSQNTFPDPICIDLLQISNFLMKTFKNL